MSSFQKLLSTTEAAEIIGVSLPNTVVRYIERGQLTASFIGRRWRIHPDDLQDFIDRSKRSR